MKAYLVTHGDYSDYRVDALFAKKADAQKVAELEGGRVEVCELHQRIPEKITYYVIERRWEKAPAFPGAKMLFLEAGGHWGPIQRDVVHHWPWDGPYWVGRMRGGVAMPKPTAHIDRIWGTNEALVEKAWKERHAAEEAEAAEIS